MTVVDVYNLEKERVSDQDLEDGVFGVEVKGHILHQVVTAQLANRRSGTAATKTRGEVRGSTKKLYRQKGTGRARLGGARSPTRRGGGVAFGPSPRKYTQKVLKKVRKAALRMALSDKLQGKNLIVIDNLVLNEIKTKRVALMLKRFDVRGALFVTDQRMDALEKSSRNIPGIKVLPRVGLNVYDVLKYDTLFLEQPAIVGIQEALIP